MSDQKTPSAPAAASPSFAKTVRQCRAEINVSKSFIYSEIRQGRLKAHKIGRATRILESDWRAYVSSWSAIEPSAAAA